MADVILNLLPLKEGEHALFEAAAPEAEHIFAHRNELTEEQLVAATVILGFPPADRLKECQQLKWFQTMWAGADDYLVPGILPEGVMLTTSSGSNSQSVAEHMLASLLALCRRIPQCRDAQLRREWCRVDRMKTISGATVLVLGAGNVGAAFASRCRALGAHTVGLKRTPGPVAGFDEVYGMDRLDEMLPGADVVALCLPHSPETVHLMNEERLAAMKRESVLLSAGRGSVLDQEALVQHLREGRFWGVALDVTDPEPLPAGHPLWGFPDVLITPHVAGGLRLDITRDNCVRLAVENLERYVKGEPLRNRMR